MLMCVVGSSVAVDTNLDGPFDMQPHYHKTCLPGHTASQPALKCASGRNAHCVERGNDDAPRGRGVEMDRSFCSVAWG